jgi:hypothetical protein
MVQSIEAVGLSARDRAKVLGDNAGLLLGV